MISSPQRKENRTMWGRKREERELLIKILASCFVDIDYLVPELQGEAKDME